MSFKVIFRNKGFTSVDNVNIRNYKSYKTHKDIPLCDDEHLSEGLKAMSKRSTLDVVTGPVEQINELVSRHIAKLEAPEDEGVDEDTQDEDAGVEAPEDESVEEAPEDESVDEAPEDESVDAPTEDDLEEMGVRELKEYCRDNDISGYSGLTKEELIKHIIESEIGE